MRRYLHIIKIIMPCILMVFMGLSAHAKQIFDLRTNYEQTPLGIETVPVFSWKMNADKDQYGAMQKHQRIMVALSEEQLKKGRFVYDSGKKACGESVCQMYAGSALQPCTRYYWQVQVWDEKNRKITSPVSWFETGLMQQGWNGAKWIGSPKEGLSKYSANLIFEYDVQLQPGSTGVGLVFGMQDKDNYWCADYRGNEMAFYYVVDGVKGNETKVGLDSLFEAKSGAKTFGMPSVAVRKHHIKITNRPEEFNRYELALEIDGKKINPSASSSVLNLGHKKWTQMCRMLNMGYKGNKGSIGNLCIKDFKHHTVLYANKNMHQFSTLQIHTFAPGEEIAAPMLRKEFGVKQNLKNARLYTTARGIYELEINGKQVSRDFYNPGYTDYNKRIMYNTYDVTSMLGAGRNVVGSTLGEGWWKGIRFFNPKWYNCYGASLSFMGKLVLEYADGTKEVVVTDESWQCSNEGPIMTNGFYEGEDYDARREIPGWSSTQYNARGWAPCKVYEAPGKDVQISAYVGQPARVDSVCVSKSVSEPTPKTFIYDMGQNMVGVPQIKIKGKRGQVITLTYGEMKYPDIIPTDPISPYTIEEYQQKKGWLYTENYRSAMNTDHYTLKGSADGEVFEPHFTCHGFRYIQITGINEALPLDDVKVLVINSLQDGNNCTYETSNPLINQLFSNVQWGERGNFVSIPTDCPQRDERAGWSGDAQIFCRAATYNRNVAPFYHRWMYTLRDDQLKNGGYPDVNPNCIWGANFGWSDVGVIIPWQVYQQYGDKQILEENYESMKRYVSYIENHAKDFIQPYGGYGDWVALAPTQSDLTNTCYAAYSVSLMVKIADALGKTNDKEYFNNLFQQIKDAFNKRYVGADGRIMAPVGSPVSVNEYGAASAEKVTEPTPIQTQTAYVVPLYMNMINDDVKEKSASYLAELVKANNYKLNTGFIGTPYLNMVLSDYGYKELAYKLIEQQEYPSWLYPVLQGATTMWERWNSYTIKNGFGPVSMNSFNHYAYGAVEDWLIAYSAGIQRDEAQPGYKHFILQPQVDGCFTHIKAEFNTVYGVIKSMWQSDNKDITKNAAQYGYTYSAMVPANTSATLRLPVAKQYIKTLIGKKGVLSVVEKSGETQIELCSGNYKFYIEKP